MNLHFEVSKEARKAMVEAVSTELGIKAKYLGMPSAAFQIGDYRIEKDGTLSFEGKDDADSISESSRVIDACVTASGTSPKEWDANTEEREAEPAETPQEATETADTAEEESMGLTVSIPLEKVLVGNLVKLLEAKGSLIKNALGISDLAIEVDEEKVSFPWFNELPEPDEVKAYTNFIAALCRMSIEQKRITATEKEVENEKYAFRCFLLRLGFIGAEFKTDRKILLSKLSGSAAFKSGAKKGGEE